ncbi:MAG: AMIN domain-containing protein, partial [Waterburya sp.]
MQLWRSLLFLSTFLILGTQSLQASELKDNSAKSDQSVSTSATNLLAQSDLTRVTGVELNQTNKGLEVILKTAAGGQKLIPLILPEGNDLVIEILDAALAFSIRNGVTELNPVPGINQVTVNRAAENSIRVRITGEQQAPNAAIVPNRDNLVLNVTPNGATAEPPFEGLSSSE